MSTLIPFLSKQTLLSFRLLLTLHGGRGGGETEITT